MTKPILALALLACAQGCGPKGLTLPSPDGGDQHFGPPLAHRPAALSCPSTRPAYDCGATAPAGLPVTCRLDSDCTDGMDGRCVGNGHDGCSCSYDRCSSDADCTAGTLCDCRDQWHYGSNGPNQCLSANCRTDADCGPGGYCSPSLDPTCGAFAGVTLWRCHTPEDSCVNDSDCARPDGGGIPFCGYRPELGHWACSATLCAG
jgi:hypothetical protein